jgi:Ala-tRNA(Pro) deacylase
MPADVKKYLTERGIKFKAFIHPAVFTVEDTNRHDIYKGIQGLHSKNLFLKGKKSGSFYLLVLPAAKRANLDALGKTLNEKVKFGNEAELKALMHVSPGSVSPFGIINDQENKVEILIDRDVWDAEVVSFHPNANTETLEVSREDFHRFIESAGNKFRVM